MSKPASLSSLATTFAAYRVPLASGVSILLLGLIGSLSIAHWAADRNAAIVEQWTTAQTKRLTEALPLRIQGYEKGVRGTRGAILVGGQEHISRPTFLIYAHSRDIDTEFPGANGFGFIRRVPAGGEALFLAEVRHSINPLFAIQQPRPHAGESDVVVLIEPSARNLPAWGLDIASDERTHAAAVAAIQSGRATLTVPTAARNATGPVQHDLLLLLPVYKPEMPLESAAQRESAAFGWAYVALRAEEVLNKPGINYQNFTLQIRDVTDATETQPFFTSGTFDGRSELTQHQALSIYGRQWSIAVQPTSQFLSDLHLMTRGQTFLLCALASLLVSTLVTVLLILARRRDEQQFKATEQFRVALEAAPTGMLMTDETGKIVLVNAQIEALFGYPRAELLGRHFEMLLTQRVQADDREPRKVFIGEPNERVMSSGREPYGLRKDGSEMPIEIGRNPLRTSEGQFLLHSIADITERQRAEELRQYMTALVESADDAIMTKSLDGIIRSWNPGAEHLLGYRAEEVIGQSVTQLIPDDRPEEESRILDQITRGLSFAHFETVRRRKDGSLVAVSLTVSPLRDGAGNIIGASKIMRDITERKRAEDAVRASEQRYRFMSEAMPQILWTSKPDGSPEFFNQRWFAYTGLTLEESKDWSGWERAVHPDDLQSVSERWNQAYSIGGDYVAEFRFRRAADGAYRWQLGRASPSRNADGVIIHWVGTCTDIHDYKEAEAKNLALQAELEERVRERTAANLTLAHSNARFETLVRLTSQVIWTNNPEGRMEGVQAGWSTFTGQSFDDYQGFGWAAAVHPDDAQPTIDEWNRCVADRRAFLFEHRVRRHDGLYRICTINGTPVLNDDGAIREWVGVHVDITERRQQEDEIRAQEAKFRFLAESLPQIVWAAGPDGGLEYFNQRWYAYTGMTPEQTQGSGWGPVLHPDDLQECIRSWSHSVATGQPLETEYRFRRASDDTYRWHLGRAVPFRDALGATVKWFGTSTDIHDYKEAEAKNLALQAELEDRVQQRTAELERVGKIAGIGGWSVTVASSALSWSDETCRIHDLQPGYQPTFDEAIGFYVPDSRRVIEAACRDCIVNSVPFDLELQVTTATGRPIWVRAVGEAQREQGAVVRIFGAFQDITTRKLAEQQLFDHHELLRVTLDSIADAVITTNALGQVQWLNPRAAQFTGRVVSDAVGLPVEQVLDIVDTQTRQRTLELLSRALLNDRPTGIDKRTVLTARDGSEIDIEDSVAPIRDKAGQVVGSVVVFRDVSERQRAAHALRGANERFTLAADAARIGVWEWDLLRNSLRWDDQMYQLYSRVPIAGLEPYSLWATSLHPEDRERAEQEINAALRENTNFDTEFRIVLPSGETRHIKAAAKIQHDGAGVAIRMIGVNFDITARKRAELDLKHTSALLRRVLDSSSDLSIIATAPDLTIRVFNKGAEHLLGYAAAEFIDSATPLAFHDAAEIAARGLELSTMLGRSIQGAGVFTEPATLDVPHEWTYIRKDQRRVPVLVNVSAMFDDSGTVDGYLGIARDITRDREHDRSLQQAKADAERANAAKSEFLANMSHEIRTPLNAVIGLGYLLEQTELSGDQRQFVTKIQFAGRALLGVINNVLDISKIEAGEMSLEDEAFDLGQLVQDLSQMLTPQAVAKGIELVVDSATDVPRKVTGDVTRVRQILTNLLSNSIKFTEVGHVTLKVFCTAQSAEQVRLRCEVEDTGIGIEPEALERLFTPFTQADASTTRRFGGTGLGLSIARRFVELMGGDIGVSSAVGVGSTFWLEIPLKLASHAENNATFNAARGLRIVIADSSGDVPDSVGAMIRSLGWIPQIAETGEALLRLLRVTEAKAWPDVLILQMPLQDTECGPLLNRIEEAFGYEALPPAILIADLSQSLTEQAAPLRASDTLLVRPVSGSALFNAINSAVSKRYGYERVMQSVDLAQRNTQWLAGVQVLVADDSDINLLVARRILENQGATVATCLDGSAAVEYVRAHHLQLDVVLMDVQMPVLDGNEAAQRIRGELGLRGLPIVALTAGALVVERQRSIAAGMNEFITKPFDPQALIRTVRRLVEEARGEPIPMVVLDRTSVGQPEDTLLIPSIDAATVKQMFGDDLSLFKSVLGRTLRDYADLALPVTVSLDDQATRSQLTARAHKLKGSAGMLGATRIMHLAGAVESALRQDRPIETVERMLEQLASALTTLDEEAQPLLEKQRELDTQPSASADRHSNGTADIGELCALLESQNLEAVNKFRALSPLLSEMFDTARFERLCDAVDNLDFQRGAELLREIPPAGNEREIKSA